MIKSVYMYIIVTSKGEEGVQIFFNLSYDNISSLEVEVTVLVFAISVVLLMGDMKPEVASSLLPLRGARAE